MTKAPKAIRVMQSAGAQEFYGDFATEGSVESTIDFTHTAGSQQGKDFVRAKLHAWCEEHKWRDYSLRTALCHASVPLINAQTAEVRISTSAFGVGTYYEELVRFPDKSGAIARTVRLHETESSRCRSAIQRMRFSPRCDSENGTGRPQQNRQAANGDGIVDENR